MRHVKARMLSRWIVVSVLLLTPFVGGCSPNTETEQDALSGASPSSVPPHRVESEQQTTPGPVALSESDGTSALGQPSADAPLSDADLVRETFGSETLKGATPDVAADGDPLKEVERPRSLFRSLGRALQQGVTDATRASSGSSNDGSQPEASKPEAEDPR